MLTSSLKEREKVKNSHFRYFFLKTADFCHTMVCKILAINKNIAEILYILIQYVRMKEKSSRVSR